MTASDPTYVTADDVRAAQFPARHTGWGRNRRGWYDGAAVDALLDQVVTTLDQQHAALDAAAAVDRVMRTAPPLPPRPVEQSTVDNTIDATGMHTTNGDDLAANDEINALRVRAEELTRDIEHLTATHERVVDHLQQAADAIHAALAHPVNSVDSLTLFDEDADAHTTT